MPVGVAAQTKGDGLGPVERCDRRLNPTRGMDVCLRVYVLCCPVYEEASIRADTPPTEGVLSNV